MIYFTAKFCATHTRGKNKSKSLSAMRPIYKHINGYPKRLAIHCIYVETDLKTEHQGCSLGLDVSVSRRSRDVVFKRLGLVETWKVSVSISSRTENQMSRSRLISVSYHRVSFTSQYAQLFASLQNFTYIVLNARRLYCLLIHNFC